jgi:hypothetical protein
MKWGLLIAGCIVLCLVPLHAHEVRLEWEIRDGTLELRGTVGTEQAAGAAVDIRSARGRVLSSGTMDEAGRYRWAVVERGPITVVMRDGFGHRRSVTITEAELGGDSAGSRGGQEGLSGWVRVLIGLTFLLALAAAWMSYCNRRELVAIQRRLHQDESRG